jgi:hypothetical protein
VHNPDKHQVNLPARPRRTEGGKEDLKTQPNKVVEQQEEPRDKQEAGRQQELSRRAEVLHNRKFKLPYQNPVPCANEKAGYQSEAVRRQCESCCSVVGLQVLDEAE